MELEMGLVSPYHAGSCGKRGSTEAFGVNKPTLTLLLRDDDDDDDGDRGKGEDGTGDARDCEMGTMAECKPCRRKRFVGWPPVKSAHRPRSCSNGGHVKVKMEGVPIGRKVDLSRHASYHQLQDTLRLMFPSSAHQGDPYAVIYEDGDGDWMLVGDVPWEEFSKSAKRLNILMSPPTTLAIVS
ncbi:auxin-responsive protein IAA20-like [Triticum dicoccoides]|uniref:auxin-responsive protein IAA20-like n=1 Tax=Triticum dicoccoides TaxID=85692 RepID=UPI0018919701|nr:auxin-responsive protein IAA20-like [Triticum dicoccoides]